MEYVEAGISYPFEVTYDSPSLYVAMEVWNVTTGTPVFVSLIPMENVGATNTYFASFTPLVNQKYVINKAVYTSNTYLTIDDNYSQGSESLRADDLAGLFLNAILGNYQNAGSVGQAIQKAANGGSGGSGSGAGLPLTGNISNPQLIGIMTIEEIGVSMNGLACCDSQTPGTLYQSADTLLNFTLYQTNSVGPNPCTPTPFNLSAATEIEILFQTVVNPPVILKYTMSEVTITNAVFGQFSALMSSANADLLALGLINIEIRVTIAGVIYVCQLIGQLTVVASLFPSY